MPATSGGRRVPAVCKNGNTLRWNLRVRSSSGRRRLDGGGSNAAEEAGGVVGGGDTAPSLADGGGADEADGRVQAQENGVQQVVAEELHGRAIDL